MSASLISRQNTSPSMRHNVFDRSVTMSFERKRGQFSCPRLSLLHDELNGGGLLNGADSSDDCDAVGLGGWEHVQTATASGEHCERAQQSNGQHSEHRPIPASPGGDEEETSQSQNWSGKRPRGAGHGIRLGRSLDRERRSRCCASRRDGRLRERCGGSRRKSCGGKTDSRNCRSILSGHGK